LRTIGVHLCEIFFEGYDLGIACGRGPRPLKDLSSLLVTSSGLSLSFGERLGGATPALELLTLVWSHAGKPCIPLPTPFGERSDLAIAPGAVVFGQNRAVPVLSRRRQTPVSVAATASSCARVPTADAISALRAAARYLGLDRVGRVQVRPSSPPPHHAHRRKRLIEKSAASAGAHHAPHVRGPGLVLCITFFISLLSPSGYALP
jgi:hypothetical protein